MISAVILAQALPPLLKNRTIDPETGLFKLPDDGFYELIPGGISPQREPETGRPIFQVVDREALELMINDLKARGVTELLIDRDHESHKLAGDTRAMGWALTNTFEIRDDEDDPGQSSIYGKVRWTSEGRDIVAGGVLRHSSPVFPFESTQDLGNRRFRPTQVMDFGLTNRPNMEGIALSNSALRNPTDKEMAIKATDPDEEISELKAEIKTLKEENQTLKNSVVQTILDANKDWIPDGKTDTIKNILTNNREMGMAILAEYKEVAASKETPADKSTKPLFNAKTAKAPKEADGAFTEDNGNRRSLLVNRRATELRGSIGWERAWSQANKEYDDGFLKE